MTSTMQSRREGTARCQWVAVLVAALAAGLVGWLLTLRVRLSPGETGIVATAVFLSVTLATRLLACRPRGREVSPAEEAGESGGAADDMAGRGSRPAVGSATDTPSPSRPRRGAAAALEAVLEGGDEGMKLPLRPSGDNDGEASGGSEGAPVEGEAEGTPVEAAVPAGGAVDLSELSAAPEPGEPPLAGGGKDEPVPTDATEETRGETRPSEPPAPEGGDVAEGGEKAMSEEEKTTRRKLADVELPDAEPLPTILPPDAASGEDEPDDLTLISGVDEDIAIELYAFGLTRFEHFAQLGPMRIKRLAAMLPEHVGINEVRNWKKAAIAMARSFGRFPEEDASGSGEENDKTAEGGTTPEQGDQDRERET